FLDLSFRVRLTLRVLSWTILPGFPWFTALMPCPCGKKGGGLASGGDGESSPIPVCRYQGVDQSRSPRRQPRLVLGWPGSRCLARVDDADLVWPGSPMGTAPRRSTRHLWPARASSLSWNVGRAIVARAGPAQLL